MNGETKKFGYDGQDLILEMNDQDSIVADYTHGPGIDNPLMMNRAGKNYYYAKDGLGSVTALTDSIGNVVHEYKYSVFGKIVDETGESVENPFTYTSREYDKETGNYFYRARYYDPEIGRFLSEDPIGFAGGINFYRYCLNDPLNWVDPFGLKVGDWWDIPANAEKAQDIAAKELAKSPSAHNDIGDALRHAAASKRVAEEVNPFTAWAAGWYHEVFQNMPAGQPLSEFLMDIHNNAEGRRAAREKQPVDPNNLRASLKDGSQYNPYSDKPFYKDNPCD